MSQKTVSLSRLLAVYSIIPVLLAAIWLDQVAWNNAIRSNLPFVPEEWIVWIYLFGLPHVVASMHTLADREYLSFYGAKLAWVVAFFLALPFVVTQIAGATTMFLIFTAFIVYHTVAQQYGIAFAALRQKPTVLHAIWKWSAVGVGAAIFIMIYTKPVPLAMQTESDGRSAMLWIAGILLAVNVIAGAILAFFSRKNPVGAWHVLACTAMIAAEFILFDQGYFALAVVLGRIIHEFTAWHIYATHDRNRNLRETPNVLFRVFRKTGIPIYPLSIILAFGVGIALNYGIHLTTAASLLISISLIHYYMESFLWKSGSIHRRHLSFAA